MSGAIRPNMTVVIAVVYRCIIYLLEHVHMHIYTSAAFVSDVKLKNMFIMFPPLITNACTYVHKLAYNFRPIINSSTVSILQPLNPFTIVKLFVYIYVESTESLLRFHLNSKSIMNYFNTIHL